MKQAFGGYFPEFAVAHQFAEDFLVAFHAIDDQAFKSFIEDITKIIDRVSRGGFTQVFVGYGFFLNLVEE
jgi:hypothetical protein